MRAPLFWVSYFQGVVKYLEALGDPNYVYHCLDYFDCAEEEVLSRAAVLVLAVSAPLREKHVSTNPRTHVVPNGIYLPWFDSQANLRARPAGIPKDKRIIGFVGNVTRHLDLKLLLELARRFPDEYLVLVGPVVKGLRGAGNNQKEALRLLQSLPNIKFVGFKPPWELARYISTFDVCLLPFVQNLQIKHSDPLKFYQYAAMGKPIVTVPTPVSEQYQHVCYLARSVDEFVRSTQAALEEPPDSDLSRQRIALAKENSWDARLAQAWSILQGVEPNGYGNLMQPTGVP